MDSADQKLIDNWIKSYINDYSLIRRKAAEPRYIVAGIDYGWAVPNQYKKVVIGDWND